MLKKIDTRGFKQIYFCGDIHGRYDLLIQALKEQQFDVSTDLLVLVGDLIDRGDYCIETIDFVLKGLTQGYICMVVGNHDLYPMGDYILWMVNDGLWFDEIKQQDETFADKIMQKLQVVAAQPFALELATHFGCLGVVHADVPQNNWQCLHRKDLTDEETQQFKSILIFGRSCLQAIKENSPQMLEVANIDFVVSGHTVVQSPLYMANRVFIDTGAFATGNLTLLPLQKIMAGFKSHL